MTKEDYKRAEMARVLARKEANGWTYETASIKTGVPVRTLSFWSRRLRDELGAPAGDAPAFVNLEPVDEPHQPDGASLEVITITGQRVAVHTGFDEATLVRGCIADSRLGRIAVARH